MLDMPARSTLLSPTDRQLLVQFGERLLYARKSRKLSSAALAQRAGISRATLSVVEKGDPSPTFGTYLRVMSALGLSADLALLVMNPPAGDQAHPMANHRLQDLQSLWLHEEAVKLLRKDPSLTECLMRTLARWAKRADINSQPLHERWADIIKRRDWKAALAQTEAGQQLRQASPLPTLLPEETRMSVLRRAGALKERARAAA